MTHELYWFSHYYNLLHFHYMPQLNTSIIKMFSLLLLYSSQTQLFITSLLLFWTIPGKVPRFITTKTYYFWPVVRFPCDYIASLAPRIPFWATAEVVPWIFAPETCDITQVLLCRNWVVPGIQSISLPGLFRANQGFYFLWVILYFHCRECY